MPIDDLTILGNMLRAARKEKISRSSNWQMNRIFPSKRLPILRREEEIRPT